MIWSRLWRCGLAAAITAAVTGQQSSDPSQQTGQHTDWPRWCGKVYEPGYPSFDPGGQTLPPPRPITGDSPLLHVQLQPRYSLYLDSEEYGEFVVNAEFSPYHGTPWPNTTSTSKWANKLVFSINLTDDDEPLVQNTVPINTTGNLFRFELSRLKKKAGTNPIEVVLYGAPESGTPTWTATTTLLYLPDKPTGSITRIDHLRGGGLHFRSAATNHTFVPYLPYGFYASYDNFLRTNSTALLDHYSSLGYTAMTPLTTFADAPAMLAYLSAHTPVRTMYDLREGYKNLSYVRANALAARDDDGLFAYWSADEPDGWQDPFAAPRQAREVLAEVDPYHPVAVVLNCRDYYFGEYSDAADIVMGDVYPVGINATFSKWGTECNATLGDCGCDDCEGVVQDVARRLDDWRRLEAYLGRWEKTKLFNPQAFHGEDYWLRDPSAEESWVMVGLAVNHGAKGVIAWVWPASDVLAAAHGKLATVLAGEEVVGYIIGGEGPNRVEVNAPGTEVVDVASWVASGKMLVSVVNGGYVDVEDGVELLVPNATVIESTPWGAVQWKLEDGKLSVPLLPALATSMVILQLHG